MDGDFTLTRNTYTASDQRWARDLLKSENHGLELKGEAWLTTFTNGVVPSGVVVARDADNLGVPAGTAGATPVGHLINETRVRTGSRNLQAVLHAGTVTERLLPTNSGISAAVKTALTAVVYI